METALTIYDDVSVEAREALEEWSRLCRSVTRGSSSLFEQALAPTPAFAQPDRLRARVWDMRRLLRTAVGEGFDKELARILNALEEHRDDIERAVVVWADLIETLVQSTERTYGARPGYGSLKAADVHTAVAFLVLRDPVAMPGIPQFIRPIVADGIADWTIDVVVLMANRYGLWSEVVPEPTSIRARLRLLLGRLRAVFRPLWLPVAWLAGRVCALIQPRPIQSPAVRNALAAIERESILTNERWVFDTLADLFTWIGSRRPQVIASFELVFAAVQEAEGYFSLTGAEKKAYARELVFAVLEDLGWWERAGLLFAVVDSLIGTSIDATVFLFNKRGVFQHRSPDTV